MSTKVGAQIKSVGRENDETTITLVLEKPYSTTLKDESVFVELHTLQGNKVEFHIPEKPAQTEEPRVEQEVPIEENPEAEVISEEVQNEEAPSGAPDAKKSKVKKTN